MAPSDISLSRIAHHPHAPVRTAAPVASQTPPATSAAAATAPSFTAVFAAMAAAAAAAGTTATSAASAPGAATLPPAALTTAAAPDGPAGPLFADNPWVTDPTGSGPGPVTHYNPVYFATPQTAQTVAQMVGGTVVSTEVFTSAPGSPFQQNEANLMVRLPNGGLINPGLVADIYTHGWNQAFINQQVANEVAGAAPASTNS